MTTNILFENTSVLISAILISCVSCYATYRDIIKDNSIFNSKLLLIFFTVNLVFYLYVNISNDKTYLIRQKPFIFITNSPVNYISITWIYQFILVSILQYSLIYWLFFKNKARTRYRYRFNERSGFMGSILFVTYLILFFRVFFIQLKNTVVALLFIVIAFVPFYLLEEYFHVKGQYLLDFLENNNASTIEAINGNYASVVLALLFSSAFFFSLGGASIYKFIIASVVLFVGLWISFSSIFNGIYSYRHSLNIEDWYNKESQIGLFTLRVSSLVILYDLLRFLMNETYNTTIIFSISRLLKFIRKDKNITGLKAFSYMDYSTVYFSQTGFYVLTMLLLWHFMRISYHSVITSILNWALFFVIDDWSIIYNYSKSFKSMSLADKKKIERFNIFMILMSAIALAQSDSWLYLIFYSIIVFVLAEQKYNNASVISLHE